ncbi:MAG: UDP-N-acetylglucosamine 4,6-dehydratase (inverting) [Chlamydiales bacterium]|nr:UDP-N-acetylglucosamine 4,6-dehydratase (inverting) [Chlamydiales bacterium]NCF70113.1 UDP-N-acetylglucosamine 4,6-dehydratase (inverting) [Chlamydiales bacterium]
MNLREFFANKSILITGGTGSFGKKFAYSVLTRFNIKRLVIFSRDEWKQWEMRRQDPVFGSSKVRYFLGDVRDKERLHRALHGVDLVVHAAALKQVPAAEYDPSEFVKTNILGAMNVIDAAIDCSVKNLIALSTDKAVNPINLYGATKLCSDKLFVAGNAYVGERNYPKFSVVRYGNVLASRGSIIPFWRQMIKDGAKSLPVTDERMTRFWITLNQAVDFVVNSFSRMVGGEIFVPKIPSMKIVDLAKAVAPHLPYNICGIREGEKLHELMICSDDARHSLEFKDYYTIVPEVFSSSYKQEAAQHLKEEGKPLPEGFCYASNTNQQWIGSDELRKLLVSGSTEDKIISLNEDQELAGV